MRNTIVLRLLAIAASWGGQVDISKWTNRPVKGDKGTRSAETLRFRLLAFRRSPHVAVAGFMVEHVLLMLNL